MGYDRLSNDEMLRIALEAIHADRTAEAVDLLKALLEREPAHVFATYLLAAEHAQLGMMNEAEQGFGRAVELAPDFEIARLQWGQIFLSRGEPEAARSALQPLADKKAIGHALPHYARGLIAAAGENVIEAIAELQRGLECPQEIPALEADMRRLTGALEAALQADPAQGLGSPAISVPVHLTKYGQPAND